MHLQWQLSLSVLITSLVIIYPVQCNKGTEATSITVIFSILPDTVKTGPTHRFRVLHESYEMLLERIV